MKSHLGKANLMYQIAAQCSAVTQCSQKPVLEVWSVLSTVQSAVDWRQGHQLSVSGGQPWGQHLLYTSYSSGWTVFSLLILQSTVK